MYPRVVRLTAEHVGRRASVRRRTPAGPATDVVGDLLSWRDGVLVVRDRELAEHRVAAADVIAARLVVARPVTARVQELERVAARGWPPLESEPLGAWQLRASGGFTHRANSVLTMGEPGLDLPAAVERVRGWYAARGLPAFAETVVPSPEDDAFAAAGWDVDFQVEVQTASVATALDRLADVTPVRVDLTARPSAAWLSRYTARGEVTADGVRVLGGGGTVAFAQAGAGPDAIGRGVVTDDWLGVTAVEVREEARGRGYAKAVTRALLDWGRAHGATRSYLHVMTSNAPARALYAGIGYRTHHRHRYREAPATG